MASTLTNLLYHIVFSTKGRHPLITSPIRDELYSYIGGIIRGEKGILLQIGGMPDHVHLAVKLRADPSLAMMVKTIKSKSSKWLNERPKKPGHFNWQVGYGAFTVSQSQAERVIEYIQQQEEHHRQVTFQDEFLALLKRHGVEFDEQYLWD